MIRFINNRTSWLYMSVKDALLTTEEYLLLKEADEIVKNGKIHKEAINLDEL